MNDEMLKIENQLCFPLYACSREVIKKYKPFLDPIGLTYTQYIVMMVLWDQKSVYVKSLGEQLYLDSGTLSPLLKKMESQGLVIRSRSAEDERNVKVTITPKGEDLKEKAITIPGKIGSCLNLKEKDIVDLRRLLSRVLEQL